MIQDYYTNSTISVTNSQSNAMRLSFKAECRCFVPKSAELVMKPGERKGVEFSVLPGAAPVFKSKLLVVSTFADQTRTEEVLLFGKSVKSDFIKPKYILHSGKYNNEATSYTIRFASPRFRLERISPPFEVKCHSYVANNCSCIDVRCTNGLTANANIEIFGSYDNQKVSFLYPVYHEDNVYVRCNQNILYLKREAPATIKLEATDHTDLSDVEVAAEPDVLNITKMDDFKHSSTYTLQNKYKHNTVTKGHVIVRRKGGRNGQLRIPFYVFE